jgi:hypothetical protein
VWDPGLTLSAVDEPGGKAVRAYFRNIGNFLARTGGNTLHESRWRSGKWENWNRDIAVYPKSYKKAADRAEFQTLLAIPGSVRMVATGHAFNASYMMGGTKNQPSGLLITLDEYSLDGGARWKPVAGSEAEDTYHVSSDQARRVVRVSAGMRLRDFSSEMHDEGMALPVAGSTNPQSLEGLIASDLHASGRSAGFLSQQVLEAVVLDAQGNEVIFRRNENVPRGQSGRWAWTPPGGNQLEPLKQLPVAGALGTAGGVVELVVMLDEAYNLRESQLFVPASGRKTTSDICSIPTRNSTSSTTITLASTAPAVVAISCRWCG